MKHGVILTDCPWAYNNYRDSANGAAKSAYDCMAAEDLCKIPVGDWAADNCVLAMWATGPMLAQGVAIDVMRAWGFQGKTSIVWLKNSPSSQDLATGVGIWFMQNAEYVLFGVRGKIGGFFEKKAGDAKPHRLRVGPLGVLVGDKDGNNDHVFWQRVSERVLIAPKDREHSKKPTTLHDYLLTFPGPYLELFGRRPRDGWTVWGKELGHELGPWGMRPYVEPRPVPTKKRGLV